jgi:hypothetical protein
MFHDNGDAVGIGIDERMEIGVARLCDRRFRERLVVSKAADDVAELRAMTIIGGHV